MTKTNNIPVPDAQGTITMKGYEVLADIYAVKHASADLMQSELDEMKEQLRKAGEFVFDSAAPGTKRVVFKGRKSAGVAITKPDLMKDGNRLNFSKALQKEIEDMGGIEVLKDAASAIDSTTKVTLTGSWATWFLEQLNAFKANGSITPDKAAEGVKAEENKKITAEGVAMLQAAAAGDGEAAALAKLLLTKGVKTLTVGVK